MTFPYIQKLPEEKKRVIQIHDCVHTWETPDLVIPSLYHDTEETKCFQLGVFSTCSNLGTYENDNTSVHLLI